MHLSVQSDSSFISNVCEKSLKEPKDRVRKEGFSIFNFTFLICNRRRGTEGQRDREKQVKTYRDLIVWQKSMDLVTHIYHQTKSFPEEERYGLILQMRRSSVSLPSNIAEGYGRNSTQDYIRFLRIANGSLFELQTQMEIALNLGFWAEKSFAELYESSREIERMLSSLIKKVNNN